MSLTVKRIARLKEPGRYADEKNLFVQVSPSGTKSWLMRYRFAGRERWMGLGSVADFNLDEARERARKARQLLADGIDPLEARAAERSTLATAAALAAAKAMTFEQAANAYYEAHKNGWSIRHAQQFRNTMRDYVLPKIGRLAVADIDVGQVLRCIEPHWQDKPTSMSRTRGRIENVLDWATVRGYRTGDNPARWRGHLSEVLPAPGRVAKVQHLAALPYLELPKFMVELATAPGIAARALEFLILTAGRTGEVANAVWSEINLDDAIWTIPAERMKAGREHRVPLSDRAVEVLQALPREGEFVFPSVAKAGAPISIIAMLRTLRRLRADGSVHGFRSAFSDWAHERTSFANHAIEISLAHRVGTGTERAYRRGDMFEKRRQLMEAWAQFCYAPTAGGAAVVSLRSA